MLIKSSALPVIIQNGSPMFSRDLEIIQNGGAQYDSRVCT